MARRYARDNRGRFATVGATARGGRLKTASGNRRATQTITAAKAGGRIAKPAGLQPGSIKPKVAAPKRKPMTRPGFEQSDFLRRSGRAATIRNPEIRAKAQGLYRNAAYSGATAKELERAFRKTSKFSTVTRPKKPKRALRAGEREHRDMLKLAPRLFR